MRKACSMAPVSSEEITWKPGSREIRSTCWVKAVPDRRPDDGGNPGRLHRFEPAPAVDVLQVKQEGVDWSALAFSTQGARSSCFSIGFGIHLQGDARVLGHFLEGGLVFLAVAFEIVGGAGPTEPVGGFPANHDLPDAHLGFRPEGFQLDEGAGVFARAGRRRGREGGEGSGGKRRQGRRQETTTGNGAAVAPLVGKIRDVSHG